MTFFITFDASQLYIASNGSRQQSYFGRGLGGWNGRTHWTRRCDASRALNRLRLAFPEARDWRIEAVDA